MNQSTNSITIRDVARLAGVSVATISRYLNGSARLAEATALKVKSAMEELQFTPHPAARNLATQRTNAIGLILNDFGGDFFTPLLEGVIKTTEAEGFNLLIFTSNHPQRSNPTLLNPMYTDGFLVFLDSLKPEDLERIYNTGKPLVLIHQTSPKSMSIPTVTIENKAASRRLVSHLIEEHGCKKIVFLRGPDGNEDSIWRESGYREALTDHDLPIDLELISTGGYDRFTAHEAIHTLLRNNVVFDGVFSGDDDAAIGVLQALKEASKSVPGDVAVVGFDDQRLAPFLYPPLTTVHAPTDQVGMLAAQQLIKKIRNTPVEDVVLLPTELVIRESCGCHDPNNRVSGNF
jgi:DNA-binding LacI/PurR family transcriptional regulator